MSTIIEIQQQLRDMTEDFHRQIIALTQELSDITVLETDVKPKKMNFSRLERLGEKRPIENHPLKAAPMDTRRRYLTFLCAVAQMTPHYADDAWLFIQRISSSVGMGKLESYAVNAMRLTEEDIEIFVDDLCHKDLRSVFVLDAMLVCLAAGTQCEKEQAFMLHIISLLDISQTNIRRLIRDSVRMAEQGLDDYADWLAKSDELKYADWLAKQGDPSEKGKIPQKRENPSEKKNHTEERKEDNISCNSDSIASGFASIAGIMQGFFGD